VNWPGVVKPDTTNQESIIGVDIYPTICEISGAKLPEGQIGDGVSLVPLLKSEVANLDQNGIPRSLFWHFPAYLQSYREVVDEQRDPLFRSRPCSVIRKGKWKLIQFFESGDLELYDLVSDIGEAHNVAASNPDVVARMTSELGSWQSETNAAIPAAANPKFNAKAERTAREAASQRIDNRQKSKTGK
jgi:arylsulfatase A-like enzyme